MSKKAGALIASNDNPSPPGRSRDARVLVVDDFQDGREMCVEYLTFLGYEVSEAADGYEALERAHTVMPDVILLDLSLPGIDGWEVTRRLKADAETRHIPIVAVTAHTLPGDAERTRLAGADAFVTKPCFLDELLEEIQRVTHTDDQKSDVVRGS